MKKGRHRRFEEARALKRSGDLDIDGIFDSLKSTDDASSNEHEEEQDEQFEDDPYDPYSEDKWS